LSRARSRRLRAHAAGSASSAAIVFRALCGERLLSAAHVAALGRAAHGGVFLGKGIRLGHRIIQAWGGLLLGLGAATRPKHLAQHPMAYSLSASHSRNARARSLRCMHTPLHCHCTARVLRHRRGAEFLTGWGESPIGWGVRAIGRVSWARAPHLAAPARPWRGLRAHLEGDFAVFARELRTQNPRQGTPIPGFTKTFS
jgi:hypothetical protein